MIRRDDGGWVDVVRWQSRQQTLAAAGRIMSDIGNYEAMRAIDPASVDMNHAEIILSL